jgi:microcystin degradation protein MlrC
MAPHEDWVETKQRACVNLINQLNKPNADKKLYKMWIPIPILLSGEMTSTRMEPAKSLYEKVSQIVEENNEIIDVALFIGYAWADEPRCHATIVTTGTNIEKMKNESEKLAKSFWDQKANFQFVGDGLTLDQALNVANSTLFNKQSPSGASPVDRPHGSCPLNAC